jgi:hypothetical protein
MLQADQNPHGDATAKDPLKADIAHPFMAPYTEALAGNGLAVTYALDETITHYGMRMLACDDNIAQG